MSKYIIYNIINYTKSIGYNSIVNPLVKNYYIKNKLCIRRLKVVILKIKILILISLIKDRSSYKKSIKFFTFKASIFKSSYLYLLKLLSFSKYKPT